MILSLISFEWYEYLYFGLMAVIFSVLVALLSRRYLKKHYKQMHPYSNINYLIVYPILIFFLMIIMWGLKSSYAVFFYVVLIVVILGESYLLYRLYFHNEMDKFEFLLYRASTIGIGWMVLLVMSFVLLFIKYALLPY